MDEASFARGHLAAELVKESLEKLTEMAKEGVKTFLELIEGTAEYGHQSEITAQQTGLTTEALQQLHHAADMTGISTDVLDTGLMRLSRSMQAAKKGSGEQAEAFHRMGIKTHDASGKLRSVEDVLEDLSDRFSTTPDGAEKTAAAMEVFGRAGARLIPMLNQGREGIAKWREEAYVMTDEEIESSKELIITQKQIAAVTRNLWRSAIAPLLPAINQLLQRYLAWRKATAEVMKQKIREYLGYAIKGVHGLIDAFRIFTNTVLPILGLVPKAIGNIIELLMGLPGVAKAAAAAFLIGWTIAAAPLLAVGAVLGGFLLILDDIRRYYASGGKAKTVYGLWKKAIDDWLKPNEQDPWWLAAIKSFVKLIQQAIELSHELDEALGRVNAKTVDKRAGATKAQSDAAAWAETSRAMRKQVEAGGQLSDVQKTALQAHGLNPELFMSTYGPGPWAPASAATTTTVDARQQHNNITAVMQPGQSTQDFAKQLSDELDARWEDANAALTGN